MANKSNQSTPNRGTSGPQIRTSRQPETFHQDLHAPSKGHPESALKQSSPNAKPKQTQ